VPQRPDPVRRRRHDRLWIALVGFVCGATGALILAAQTWARPPVPGPVFAAVRAHWHTRTERVKAFDVIACETGGTYSTRATNGQFRGMFQMGAWARARYGHGTTATAQARAAHRYYLAAGWAPWSCA
jgi:hypothetical protein